MYSLRSVRNTSAFSKSFQFHEKSSMASVASAGLARGSISRKKIRPCPAPSIKADSVISLGMPMKNCRSINTPKIVNRPGRISAQWVL
ncbi:hypothetical protein D3C71_2063180 [compost metagenome]